MANSEDELEVPAPQTAAEERPQRRVQHTPEWAGRLQEIMRGGIAGVLLLLVVAIIFAAYACAARGSECSWANVKDWFQIALPATTGFLGLSLAFYYSIIVKRS